MTCSPVLISAYHDGALAPSERRQVEAHLRQCPACRAVLRDYQTIRLDIGGLPRLLAPDRLRGELWAQIAARRVRPDRGPRWSPLVAAAAAVAVLLIAALAGEPLAQPPNDRGNARPVVAFALPQDQITGVHPEAVIEIRFNAPVDREAVQRSLLVWPPVPARLEWQQDKVLIVPEHRLDPDTTYTISFGALDQQPEPVQFSLRTGHAPTLAAAAAGRQPDPVEVSTPTPTAALVLARPSATPMSPQAPAATYAVASVEGWAPTGADACAVAPGPRLSRFATKHPDATQRLGCPLEPERSSTVTEQPFEGGTMLWSADLPPVYVLNTQTGTWTAYEEQPHRADRPTGDTPAPQGPTTLAAPAPRSTWTVATQPLWLRPAQATTPPPAGSLEGWRRFTHLWLQDAGVRNALGMPTEKDFTASGSVQVFAHALALGGGRGTTYLLLSDRSWRTLSDGSAAPALTATPTAP
ncbi:MAG: zf-HC2 domain-containing protein [Chloroflexi bacterium]|nr:zf-HC2 domain-containing protein [Chloroflexota bacterium]